MKKIFLSFFLFGIFFSSVQAVELDEIASQALKEKKLILLTVESTTCVYCELMEKQVFSPKENAQKLKKQYIRKVVMADKEELPKGIKALQYPTNIIIHPRDMRVVDQFVGYIGPNDFFELLDIIYNYEIKK